MTSSNQNTTPAQNSPTTAPAKKDEQSNNPASGNTPSSEKSSDKR